LTLLTVGQYPVHVKSITYTAARENLASTINRVCEDDVPVVITRNRDQAVVMLSLAEYESLQETAYLLRSPANAKRLLNSLDAVKRGKLIRKKLKLGA
jgi:antitoxin YefM